MKSVQCSSSVSTTVITTQREKKAVGKQIARLEQKLVDLDKFENDVKNNMQDRMKFMGGRNAKRKDRILDEVGHKQNAIRADLARLQELI